MLSTCVSYQNSGFFSDLIVDYFNDKLGMSQFYNRLPILENFKEQMDEKALKFTVEKRKVLADTLCAQYDNFKISSLTEKNINLLRDDNTFTITTGHQLNLFTGPLYFLYKIVSVINLCKKLQAAYPDKNFVPVYWMATEDHDFEEINYFNYKGKKIVWNSMQSGAVGRFSTRGLEEVYKALETELGIGKNADYLKELFEKSYLQHNNLADATRFLANELFGTYGLVIIDGDNHILKNEFAPYIQEELVNQQSFAKVQGTIENLQEYKIQVNPREINLFYIDEGVRERIVYEDHSYKVNNTDIVFTQAEILHLVEHSPEKFSPNVILRPLYQEVILPNLCYVGGAGEIAYWLELKSMFDYHDVTFPMLLIRNSVVIISEKQLAKAEKLQLTLQNLFQKTTALLDAKTRDMSEIELSLAPQKEILRQQFADLNALALQTDKSFMGVVKAQEAKQIKGLEHLEKRLLKAQKRKYDEQLQRILKLKNDLFPNDGLQERIANFSEFYDANLIERLVADLNPTSTDFYAFVI